MISEITEEKDEEDSFFIDNEAQKERIRRIIEYQKSLYLSSASSSSLSSSATSSSSSLSSSRRSSSLFSLMKRGNTSLRRLFDMEHTSLANHFNDYSASPIVKPILLWGSDADNEKFDPWASIKQFKHTYDSDIDAEDKFSSKVSFVHTDFRVKNTKVRHQNRKLTRKKSFRRLPGFGLWTCRGFRIRLRLKLRKLRIVICRKKKIIERELQ